MKQTKLILCLGEYEYLVHYIDTNINKGKKSIRSQSEKLSCIIGIHPSWISNWSNIKYGVILLVDTSSYLSKISQITYFNPVKMYWENLMWHMAQSWWQNCFPDFLSFLEFIRFGTPLRETRFTPTGCDKMTPKPPERRKFVWSVIALFTQALSIY